MNESSILSRRASPWCICPDRPLTKFECGEAPDPPMGTWCIACRCNSLETMEQVDLFLALHPVTSERIFLRDCLPLIQLEVEKRRELNAGLERPLPSMAMPVIPFQLDGETTMTNHLRFLKVKLKALAAEARIIRLEEQRTRNRSGLVVQPELYEALHIHRVVIVRRACRDTHLAYGFLRGKEYHALERSCREQPDWKSIAKMVAKYGTNYSVDDAVKALEGWRAREVDLQVAA